MNELETSRKGVALFLQGWSGDVGPNRALVEKPGDGNDARTTYQRATELARLLVSQTDEAIAGARELPGDRLRAVEADADLPTGMSGVNTRVAFRAIAIGDRVAIVAVSGEVFQDYGPILTSIRSDLFMPSCGLANGYAGYIPTKAGFDYAESYELKTTPYTPAAEGVMRAQFAKLLAQI